MWIVDVFQNRQKNLTRELNCKTRKNADITTWKWYENVYFFPFYSKCYTFRIFVVYIYTNAYYTKSTREYGKTTTRCSMVLMFSMWRADINWILYVPLFFCYSNFHHRYFVFVSCMILPWFKKLSFCRLLLPLTWGKEKMREHFWMYVEKLFDIRLK